MEKQYSTLKVAGFLLITLLLWLGTTQSGQAQEPNNAEQTMISTTGAAPSCLNKGNSYCWALLGNDGQHLEEERSIGLRAKLFSLSWRSFTPSEGVRDTRYIERKLAEYRQLRAAGFEVFLSLGIHDTPTWIHENYQNSYYVNQYGQRYHTPGLIDQGDANLVFNAQLRALADDYIAQVFATFGTDFAAVRLGGGRYGELTYPPHNFGGQPNSYWGYDASAQAQTPAPGWKPGDASHQGEATRFLEWYLDALVDFQEWQITTVREHYKGPLMMLYPSWGIRPGNITRALQVNLAGSTPAESNGEVPRGFDFARQIAAINDPNVIVTTTWLDADPSADEKDDPRYWSPVKYLATLAAAHPLRLKVYGENTGHGSREKMLLSAAQMQKYGLVGMAWYKEQELFSGEYATSEDLREVIADTVYPEERATSYHTYLPLMRR